MASLEVSEKEKRKQTKREEKRREENKRDEKEEVFVFVFLIVCFVKLLG